MKFTDRYDAKLQIWAGEAKVCSIPEITNLPRFGHKKFSSYQELNEWKKALILELAGVGGAQWKKS